MDAQRDKLIVDTTGTDQDTLKLKEYFSRQDDGAKVKFSGEGTIDENADGVVVISFTKIQFEQPKGGKKAPMSEPAPASVMAMRGDQPDEVESAEEEAAETPKDEQDEQRGQNMM
jgi:hypothetical protein